MSAPAPKSSDDLLTVDDRGLYCPRGDVYIDPWQPVPRALITHGHSDHARPDSEHYWTAEPGRAILERRLHPGAAIEAVPYGQTLRFGDARVSFHPAGHILGSAQVRVEVDGEVWVVSGDYKRQEDPTCTPFEVVRCDVFITEATFAMPVFRWPSSRQVAAEILQWWLDNRRVGRNSVLFTYALGKCQRLLAELRRLTDERVFLHGALVPLTEVYRRQGCELLPTTYVGDHEGPFRGELILAPPSARGTTWMRRFGRAGTGFASGWMRVRGTRRRRSMDRGFVLSDHVDWHDLLTTIKETGARRVLTTHGYTDTLARFLTQERDLRSEPLKTLYSGEAED